MGVSILVPIGLIIKEYTSHESTMSTVEFVIIIFSMLLFALPIFFMKLKTRIDEYGIHYQFIPFHRSTKTIAWNEINNIYVRDYDPIGEYGGWGLKAGWGKKRGKAINVAGSIGIQLELNLQL